VEEGFLLTPPGFSSRRPAYDTTREQRRGRATAGVSSGPCAGGEMGGHRESPGPSVALESAVKTREATVLV